MNESVLQTLMRLFALVAFVNEEGKASIDREIVEGYLRRQFSSELVNTYLKEFDRYLQEYHPDLTSASDDEKKARVSNNSDVISELCNQLNQELEQQSKVFILVYLLDFIASGSQLTGQQFSFVEQVARNLHIPEGEYHDLKHFTLSEFEKVLKRQSLLYVDADRNFKDPYIKHLYIDKFDGRIVVLHVESTNTYVFRYYGTQVLFLNGHNIKTNRSYIWAVGSVVKNSRFGSVYYTWVAGRFIKADATKQFVFTAHDIEFSYGTSPNGIKRFNLNEESGRLIGIIGGSGSGKSTLLKVLCGLIKPKKGKIEINNYDIHENKDEIKGVIGYVPQDDVLIKELTVFENLFYNAKLSFSNYTDEEITRIVEKALLDFDLVEARDLRVGDTLTTYLSGGQRKRLNIALELLREPAILFIDEPTSGLSSMDSEKVMNLLKRQTFKGKLVFANIHQPSSEIFKLLDKLLVVDQGGRIIYYGNPLDALTYFKTINHHVDADERECLVCGNINVDQILRNIEGRVVDVNGRLTRKRKTSPQEWYEIYMERIDPIIRNISRKFTTTLPKSNFSIPTRWKQGLIYFIRDVYAKLKNSQYLIITLLEAPVLALLLAFYTRSATDISGKPINYVFGLNKNIPSYLFMAVIVALFLGMVISAEEIFRDRKIMMRERFLNLSRLSYLLSKVTVMFMISAIQMFLFVLIGNTILEIKGMWWQYFVLLFTTSAWANVVGLNISSGFKSVVTIYILVPLILVPQLLFSGVVVDFYNLNNAMRSTQHVPLIGDMMTSRWAYEALVVSQFRDNPLERELFPMEQNISEAMYYKGYLIPELFEVLDDVKKERSTDPTNSFREDLALLQKQVKIISDNGVPGKIDFVYNLKPDKLDDEVIKRTSNYLLDAQSIYHQQYLKASFKKDRWYTRNIEKYGGKEKFIKRKNKYENQQLASLVRNDKETMQFFRHGNKIIKLKDPIYTLPFLKNGRAHFYSPYKRIGNVYFDTYWFNIIVVWLSIVVCFVLLYYDVIFRVINYIDSLKLQRFNKRIINRLNKQIGR